MGKFFVVICFISLSIPQAYGGSNSIINVENIVTSSIDNQSKRLSELIVSHNFETIGESTFSLFFWDLYKSKLMTTTGKYPISIENKPERLIFVIEYLTDINRDDLIEHTIEQWQHIGLKESEYLKYVNTLKSIWPDITEGDSLALLIQKDKSEFYHNDKYLGGIDTPYFGQMFIDIWLSKKTSQPSLRKALLGEGI